MKKVNYSIMLCELKKTMRDRSEKKDKSTPMKYFLLVFMLCTQMAYAIDDVQSTKKSGTQLQPGAFVETLGNRYATSLATPTVASRPYWTEGAYGLVTLTCPSALTNPTALTGSAVLNVLITYDVEYNGVFVTQTKTQLLTLEFMNTSAQDQAFVKVEGAQRVKAEILTTGNVFPAAWPDLELEVKVNTQSYEWMVQHAILSTTLAHLPALTTDGNLQVNWTAISSAEYYELEWTYVSNQGATPSTTLSPSAVRVDRFLFRNNSSRVEVKGLSYQIPMIYEKGFIMDDT
jgi:hypothetical protein